MKYTLVFQYIVINASEESRYKSLQNCSKLYDSQKISYNGNSLWRTSYHKIRDIRSEILAIFVIPNYMQVVALTHVTESM